MKNKNKSINKEIFSTMLQDFVMCLKVIVFIALCISIVAGLCYILYWLIIVYKLYWIIAIVVIIIALSEWYHSAKERVLSKKMEEEK